MKESFAPLIKECLDILNRDDIKTEIKKIFNPLAGVILYEINPYIYIITSLVFLIFLMILTNFIILIMILRNKHLSSKLF
jgi:hypothetical protein